ncbi:MAG: TonB-dependent receptor [Bacteroidota bacterium]
MEIPLQKKLSNIKLLSSRVNLTTFSKYAIFFLVSVSFLSQPVGVIAQNLKDTLSLPEFEIKSNFILDNQGFKRTKIDSSILVPQVNANLSTILSQHSTIFIKSYGNNTLSTSSFRGTTAQHTQVEWNGINLNSPMLGQIDFSQIQVSQFDGLEILYGAAGISRTSGAFGGVIDLVTSPDWNNLFNATLAQSIASFDSYTTNVSATAGNKAFQSHTKFNFSTALNDFHYKNDKGEVMQQNNASNIYYDISQEFFYKLHDKHLFSAKVWYNNNIRNLPSAATNADINNDESQKDNALRAIMEYKYVEKNYNLLVRSALVSQYMNYIKGTSINAKYQCYSFINRIRFSYNRIHNFTFKPGVDYTYDWVYSDSYNGLKTRSTASFFIEINYNIGKKINTSLILRQELIDGKFIPIVPAIGAEYRPFNKINLAFSSNFARNYRYPTLNDMFWELSGNPDLKPETNYTTELGSTFNFKTKKSRLFIEASLTGYFSWIYDMITWLPVAGSNLWKPENIDEVLARGIEAGLNVSWEILHFNIGLKNNYNFCRSTYEKTNLSNDNKIGKQLIYVPVHTFNSTVSLERWKFYAIYNFSFISNRYTGKDNLSYMPAYDISNIILGKNISLKNFMLSLQFEINNLLNLDYQSIASRPMPGINYAFTFKLFFTNPRKQ